jgi:hypothetical protein
MVSRSLFTSKKVYQVTDSEAALFVGLVVEADDEGRGEGEPFALRLKFANRTWSDTKLETMLKHLDEVGLIWWYKNGQGTYYEVVDFMKHQRGSWHGKCAVPSEIPSPGNPESTLVNHERCSATPEAVEHSTTSGPNRTKGKGIEDNIYPSPAGSGKFEYPQEFEDFWSAYPRRVEKRKAYRLWLAHVQDGVKPADLAKAAGEYSRETKDRESEHIKHPSTFLAKRDRPFEDYIEKAGANAKKVEADKKAVEKVQERLEQRPEEKLTPDQAQAKVENLEKAARQATGPARERLHGLAQSIAEKYSIPRAVEDNGRREALGELRPSAEMGG